MIIGVDAAVLGVTDERLKVGVYNFVVNLLENLAKIDTKNKYLLYSFFPIQKDILDKFDTNWTNLVLQPKKGWLSLRLSLEFLRRRPDIFLGFGQALPFYHPAQNIIFVYDLAFELYPQFYKDSYKRLSKQTRYAVKNCEKIVTISKTTRRDLVKLYKVDPEKIDVIYPGVGINSSTHGESLHTGYPRGVLSQSYFLFVGSYKPGKNIENIVKAFKLFRNFSTSSKNKHLQSYQLILAGSNFWDTQEIHNQVHDDKVIVLGYVSSDDLVQLYKNATAFISPSYYEGFGIPILEAMTYGVPVITSKRGSIPEVVNNAAVLVNPDDSSEIKNAMVKMATDKNLRSQMIKKGIIQTKKFSWEKSAVELLKIINNI